MVSEGYYATKVLTRTKLWRQNPIIDAVHEILYEGKDAKTVFKKLTDKSRLRSHTKDSLFFFYQKIK
jgi:glycerol-3-phosphate dehydrogenase (NAD(P)+)